MSGLKGADPRKATKAGLFRPARIAACPDDPPLLVRWRLFGCRRFRVLLHHFLQSDSDREMHDHPWPFTSIILAGGYIEETPEGRTWHPAGSVLRRPAEWRHRVVLPEGRRSWSLVVTGRRSRAWGFWTATGWVDWVTFGRGRPCGEDGRTP